MKQEQRLNWRLVVAALCLGALAAGCVNAPPPKVAIENLQSDILFGAPPEQVVDAPPQQTPFAQELPPLEFPSFVTPAPRPFVPLAPSGDCPTAPFTAFPDESASTNVEQPPKEGAYKWQRSGFVTVPVNRSIALSGLQRSLVRRIAEQIDPGSSAPSATPSRTFTFQTVQPIAEMKLLADFQVRTNGQAADPERGVVLKRLQLQNPNGTNAFSFMPQPVGLLYLPLPVAPAAVFTSEAVDPTSGERWSISGKVTGRQRVDACGDLVEGWLVESDLTFSGARSGTQKFEYVIAPQRGGVIVREKWAGEGHLRGAANAEFIIGQLNADPLTQAEK